MRIDGYIPVTGKMFSGGEYPIVLQPLHILNAEYSNPAGIFTERAVVDHGIFRVVIYIHYRSIVDLYSHAFALVGDGFSVSINQLWILHGTEHHLAREGKYAVHTH